MTDGIYRVVSPLSNFVYIFTDPSLVLLLLLPIFTTHKCVPAQWILYTSVEGQ